MSLKYEQSHYNINLNYLLINSYVSLIQENNYNRNNIEYD